MDGSIGNEMSQSGQGDYSPENSIMETSKPDGSKRSNNRGTPKTKRRSKNETAGRNFKWNQCDKSYLSYPALYTHKKTKHPDTDSKTPKQVVPSSKRGRPPKNEKINPSSDKYFETEDKKAGDSPADLIGDYEQALAEYKNKKIQLDNKLFVVQLEPKDNPLLKALHENSEKDIKTMDSKSDFKTCDVAYAVYLKHCSEKVNSEFYRTICKFIILYREVFNQYGPDKFSSDDSTAQWEKEFYQTLHRRYFDKSFSELVGTEFLPDVVNELYVFFQYHYKKLNISQELMKELTLNFNTWLYKKGLTTARVIL